MNKLSRFYKEIRSAVLADKYTVHQSGVVSLFNDGLVIRGEYVEGVNGKDWRTHKNLLVDEGIKHMLNVVLGSTSKISTWYIAPFSGSSTPAANWTAANFTANSSEITSGSEGYSESVRQTATFTNATSSDQIDNYSNLAAFTIVTASSLNVNGLGLLSASAKGATTGTLMSATKFGSTRVLQDTDVWNAGYRVILAGA